MTKKINPFQILESDVIYVQPSKSFEKSMSYHLWRKMWNKWTPRIWRPQDFPFYLLQVKFLLEGKYFSILNSCYSNRICVFIDKNKIKPVKYIVLHIESLVLKNFAEFFWLVFKYDFIIWFNIVVWQCGTIKSFFKPAKTWKTFMTRRSKMVRFSAT